MHALGRFISELMTARNMSRPDLERASGLSRQHIHQLLDDSRTRLGRMVDDSTIAGLSRAFADISETAFISKAAESMGVPVDRLSRVEVDIDRLSDEALLGILAQRLKRAATGPGPATERPFPMKDQPADGQGRLAARRGHLGRERLEQEWGDEPANPSAD